MHCGTRPLVAQVVDNIKTNHKLIQQSVINRGGGGEAYISKTTADVTTNCLIIRNNTSARWCRNGRFVCYALKNRAYIRPNTAVGKTRDD
jgi:hypothetical protein